MMVTQSPPGRWTDTSSSVAMATAERQFVRKRRRRRRREGRREREGLLLWLGIRVESQVYLLVRI